MTENHISEPPTAAARRPSISKSLRFEVFKRDSFTCQYCGRRAPDVTLHCDHVKPLVEGGEHTILNLTTACMDCNLGKGRRELSDQAVLSKKLNQLVALQERKEQMEMMIEWQEQLSNVDEIPITHLGKQWEDATGYEWLDSEKSKVRKLIKQMGVDIVAKAMQTSLGQYLDRDENGLATMESVDKCFDGLCAIARVEYAELREPGTKRLYLIRGGLRHRFYYCNERLCLSLMKEAAKLGVSVDHIEKVANASGNWSQFRDAMETLITECQDQIDADAEWRKATLARLSDFRKNVSDDAILDLVIRSQLAGISEEYIIGISHHVPWHSYKECLELQIQWRLRFLEPLRAALGGFLPDDWDLVYVFHALLSGMTDNEILGMAHEYKNWPRLKESLSNFVDSAEGFQWDADNGQYRKISTSPSMGDASS